MVFSDNDIFKIFIRKVCQQKLRHDTYQQSCDHADDMSVHLYGNLPVKLLNLTRPREDAETKAYRLSAYQPTTKSTTGKAISILAKIFNPILYSIRWKKQTADGTKLENYTLKEYPEFNSVVNFLSDSLLKKMLADPNAIVAVRPSKLTLEQTEAPQALAKVYGSHNVYYKEQDFYLVFIRKEAGVGMNGNLNPGGGDIWYFECYDIVNITEFAVQFPNPNTTIITSVIYPHGCPRVPVWQLKGIPDLMDNGSVMYKSFFDDALSHWNLAVMHESDLFGAYINHLHPLRAELAEECDYIQNGQRCQRGKIANTENGVVIAGTTPCPSCNGSGYRSVKSPYGVYQYNKEKLQEGTTSLTPVQYITIPTDATKMLEERVDKMHEKGLNAINMDIVNKVGANQSGTAKVIDRSELNDFLYKISSVLFDLHLHNIFFFFNYIMFKVSAESKPNPNDAITPDPISDNLPEINKPVNFDIMTEAELLNDLEVTKKVGLSPEYIRQAQKQILAKKFATSPDIATIMTLVVELDPVPDYMVSDIISLQSGAQKMWPDEWVICHFNMGHFIDRAMEENENFVELEEDQQFDILLVYAKEVMAATKTKLAPPAQPDANGQPAQPPVSGA